jgi:hypothetical protein
MPAKKAAEPQITLMPPQKMAVVQGKGTPEKVFGELMPALYGSAYSLRFDNKKKGLPVFKVTGLRARYPDAHLVPMPETTTALPQKVPGVEVRLETWPYGTVAQVLHLGPYDRETPTIERLQAFIDESGYEMASDHEEEYLTRPDARVPRTIIRYVVKKRK